ncbi:MAG: non-ribosomal peptide synthetase, partial [Gemmataceae bacterium]
TTLGRRTFVGNHAVILAGHDWPDDLFVGVATVPDPAAARPGSGWFGQPPLELPRREVVEADRRVTHAPGPLRYANRAFWELLRFALPLPLALVWLAWYAGLAHAARSCSPAVMLLAVAPLVTAAAVSAPCLGAIALKWLLLGRVRPGRHPLWSCWCSRWDFHYIVWGQWARDALEALEGTLLLNAVLRLVGVRVGRRVVLGDGSSAVVDPDMLRLEDGATVVGHFQAHSFEDRVLKIDAVRVGPGATVGAGALVLYGADVGAGAWVGPHAVVMKQERLAPRGRYVGYPVAPAP